MSRGLTSGDVSPFFMFDPSLNKFNMEKKSKILIGKINNTEIFAINSDSGEILVPIRPICEAIGIDPEGQRRKISEDEDLNSVADLRSATGTDGKQYKMLCLPLIYVYGWLFTINPKNVAPEARESVRKYRMECYEALYNHFFRRSDKLRELDLAEREAIARLESLESKLKEAQEVVSGIKAAQVDTKKRIDKIRSARLDDQPSLFG